MKESYQTMDNLVSVIPIKHERVYVYMHGKDDYSAYFYDGDWSIRGTFADIIETIKEAICNARK